VLHGSRRISASGSAAAAERQFRRRTVQLVLAADYFTVLPAVFSLLQAPAFAMPVWGVAFLATVLAFTVTLMRAGQGGARLATAAEPPIGDRTPDARWIAGFIYFNRTDPALLVEKRMGIGWTLNFGNPWSWVPLMALALAVVLSPILMRGSADPRTPASPGTEESLRHYIDSLATGRPNYEEMSPQLAASVRQQLPKIMAIVARLGGFRSLTYTGTDADGSDVYEAAFDHGKLEWHIAPLVGGKVTKRSFRALCPHAEACHPDPSPADRP
jgi:hypothetical protein